MNFSVIDFIFLGLILLFIIRCYLKGFVSELLSMAGIVLGILASLFFYKNVADFIREKFWPDLSTIPEIVAFVSLFIIVCIIVKILEKLLTDIVDRVNLGSADSLLGIVFGLAEGIAVVCLILFLLRVQPIFSPDSLLSESFFARLLLPLITGKESVPSV